ncbi:hypothetical protein BS17DRAFT_73059 [Gyrodon lividus]|nr:hypothetical protein BS17DRAFT_73059 [Gyrodon lividus]
MCWKYIVHVHHHYRLPRLHSAVTYIFLSFAGCKLLLLGFQPGRPRCFINLCYLCFVYYYTTLILLLRGYKAAIALAVGLNVLIVSIVLVRRFEGTKQQGCCLMSESHTLEVKPSEFIRLTCDLTKKKKG